MVIGSKLFSLFTSKFYPQKSMATDETATDELKDRVSRLSYEALVEAATLFLPMANGISDPEAVERKLAAEVQQRGGRRSDLEECLDAVEQDERASEYLLREVLLQKAGGSEEDKNRLGQALNDVGKSQGVDDVRDAIFAATLLGMLWLAHPPTEQHTTTSRETHKDGTEVETTEVVVNEIPPPIDKLFEFFKGLKWGR
jgi:hypothetical protein